MTHTISSRWALLLYVSALLIAVAGCSSQPGPSVDERTVGEVLDDVRFASLSVESFRSETTFPTPIPGSTQLNSITRTWQHPDLAITTALGAGEPKFQQAFQQGDDCHIQRDIDAEWERHSIDCGPVGNGTDQLVWLTNLTDPGFVDVPLGGDPSGIWIRGIAPLDSDANSGSVGLPGAPWDLHIVPGDLISQAIGYSIDSEQIKQVIDFTEFNTDFTSEFESIKSSINP